MSNRLIPLILLSLSLTACAGYVLPPDLAAVVDPNRIVGELLPPICGDPNTWELPVGKYIREGTCKNVHSVVEDAERSTPPVSTGLFVNGDTWTYEMWIQPGLNYRVVCSYGDPKFLKPKTRWYTVVIVGVSDEEPILD